MAHKKLKRIASMLVAISMISSFSLVNANADEVNGASQTIDIEYVNERLSANYTLVSLNYGTNEYKGEKVNCLINSNGLNAAQDKKDYKDAAYDVNYGSTVQVTINAPEKALYRISVDYMSIDNSILPIEIGVKLNGEYPFYEARSMKLKTTWLAETEASYDRYENQIVSLPDKLVEWQNSFLLDASYRYSEPLLFELEKGENTLDVNVIEGKFILGNFYLEPVTHIDEYEGSSEKATGSDLIRIQGEGFAYRNDASIHAAGEIDTKVYPFSVKETVLNTLDSTSFKTAGQTVTYDFEAPNDGYYYIGTNYKQSDKNGFPVFIDWAVDGEIPNTAFKSYPMKYTTKYKRTTLQDENGDNLSVYLEKGTHTISMTISADYLRESLESVDIIMNGINDLSLEVTKVAGTNKDKYRDLKLTKYIPDIKERLDGWVDELTRLESVGAQIVGEDSAAAFGYLLVAAKQLASLAKDPNELIYRVSELSTSVNSINTQISNFVDAINKHRISVDEIYIYQEDAKFPKQIGFFKGMGLKIQRFFNSFFGQSYSVNSQSANSVKVWVNRPRQYVEIIQKMIDTEFTPKTGIEVDLALMTDANKLVLANASGETPDIATGINYSIPFELGIRGALVDLSTFEDYREVFERYNEGILVSSVIGDGLYSLPETMNFYVMFYRSDIMDKLGLEIPDTMDDLIGLLPDLQMRGLNVYYPTAPMLAMRTFHGTTPLIFQNGGTLYGETADIVTLSSESSIRGFTQLTELFTIYDMPIDVPNFYQHFRNGDLPIGIADFNSYNLLTNAAPEIENSWGISLVPGVVDETTGEINRYMSGGAESTVMFASNEYREQRAWEFMKWWSSADVQAEFGETLQIMYGDEYMWTTANLEAFARLPYSTSDKSIIMEQAENILEAPRLLGSYMLEREMSNAFNAIVINGKTLRTRLDKTVKTVERETDRKLEEFGFTSNGETIEDYIVPSVEQVRKILQKSDKQGESNE